MALFTEEQANACIIKKCNSIKKDGVHQYWQIEVLDTDGHVCTWIDEITAGDADDATLATAIGVTLTTQTMKHPAVLPVYTNVEKSSIINTTVG